MTATGSGPTLGSVQTPSSHSLSLPSPSLSLSSPPILSNPRPWVTSRPSVPSGFPEPSQSAAVRARLSQGCCQRCVQGNTQSQMHTVPSKTSMSCGQSARGSPAASPASSRLRPAGGQLLQKFGGPQAMEGGSVPVLQTRLISPLNLSKVIFSPKTLSLDQPNPYLQPAMVLLLALM